MTQSLQVVYLASVPVKEWIEVEVNVLKLGARVVVISVSSDGGTAFAWHERSYWLTGASARILQV